MPVAILRPIRPRRAWVGSPSTRAATPHAKRPTTAKAVPAPAFPGRATVLRVVAVRPRPRPPMLVVGRSQAVASRGSARILGSGPAIASGPLPDFGPATTLIDVSDIFTIDPYRASGLADDSDPFAVDPYRATFST